MDSKNFLITGLIVLFTQNISAQGVISCTEMNVLYRGYNNIVAIGTGGLKQEVFLIGEGVSLSKIDSTSYYAHVNGGLREATIYAVSKTLDTFLTRKFRVRNLPPPTLFLGENEDSKIVTVADTIISSRYANELFGPISATFEILNYEVIIPGEKSTFKGKGNTFSQELIKVLIELSLNSPEPIPFVIQAKVKGPDGVIRNKSGSFLLQ